MIAAVRILLVVLLLFSSYSANAQLCQGSLGDPIINTTFGSGSNPGPSLTAAATNYQYVTNDCPNDGFYTVRNNTSNCFSSSWHNLTADHTGNSGGYFMLVNASVQPSAFYVDTVRGLCSNTTFEFAAWVINVLRTSSCGASGIQPNLTFTIERTDGIVLQTYNTNNIPSQPSPVWQQYGFFFTTPPGVFDVVLRIFNNSQGGCGNDLALDDITFRPCGPQVTPVISGYSSTTVSYCEGISQSFVFNAAISAGFSNPSFQWQQSNDGVNWADISGATSITFSKNFPATTAPGNYMYRLSTAETGNLNSVKCRVASALLTIRVLANPVTTISSNTPLCQNGTLSLSATGGSMYQWTGVNGFSATGNIVTINNVQLIQSGKYYVLVTNTDGCFLPDSVTININPAPVATTAFTGASICAGDNIQLFANGGITYRWLPSSGLSSDIIANPVASPADTIQYKVIVSNQYSCSDTAFVDINAIEKPKVNAGPDRSIIAGTSVQLSGIVSGQNISYYWSPSVNVSNTQVLQPIVTPASDAEYTLTAESGEGCGTAIDKVNVFVYKDVFVPTAFTPNNDGINDTWNIPALNAFSDSELSVYNRYGQLVFQSKNNYRPWNGMFKGVQQPSGIYVYTIHLNQIARIIKGTVLLIR